MGAHPYLHGVASRPAPVKEDRRFGDGTKTDDRLGLHTLDLRREVLLHTRENAVKEMDGLWLRLIDRMEQAAHGVGRKKALRQHIARFAPTVYKWPASRYDTGASTVAGTMAAYPWAHGMRRAQIAADQHDVGLILPNGQGAQLGLLAETARLASE